MKFHCMCKQNQSKFIPGNKMNWHNCIRVDVITRFKRYNTSVIQSNIHKKGFANEKHCFIYVLCLCQMYVNSIFKQRPTARIVSKTITYCLKFDLSTCQLFAISNLGFCVFWNDYQYLRQFGLPIQTLTYSTKSHSSNDKLYSCK